MSDNIPLAGVIGDPISHSKSPVLQGHWLRRYGLEGHYVPLHVTAERLEDTLRLLPQIGFRGLNVTIPHKETVLDLADTVTDRAALIGAANTLTFLKNGKVQADNTDGVGFMANLQQGAPWWDPTKGPVVVLGAGGAARAVISALIAAGVPEIRLANRTRLRSEALKQNFGAKVAVFDWIKAVDMLEDASLVVNTTSLGMTGKAPLKLSLDKLPDDAIVTDIVYTPLMTPLLDSAHDRGCTVIDGLGMLLHQAVPGFERWFGVTPQVDDDLRAAVLNA